LHLVPDFSFFLLNFESIVLLEVLQILIMLSFLINTSIVGLAFVGAVNGASPDISGVSIKSYSHGGSACPQGSTDFSINVEATR
jgi:hypothetical protein